MIRVHRLNNQFIIVKGERTTASGADSFEHCWSGHHWASRISSAKKFATRIEAQAELDRFNEGQATGDG